MEVIRSQPIEFFYLMLYLDNILSTQFYVMVPTSLLDNVTFSCSISSVNSAIKEEDESKQRFKHITVKDGQ